MGLFYTYIDQVYLGNSVDMGYCYLKMSVGDIERKNRRSRLRSGWDDAESVESLRVMFCSWISFQQRFCVKFVCGVLKSSKMSKKKGFNEEQIPTAVLVGGLGVDKDKCSTYIVYKVSPDRGY